MAIDKNYAIIEIANIFLKATDKVDADKYDDAESLYREVAKVTFEDLKVIFQLFTEPVFKEDEELLKREDLLAAYQDEIKELKDCLDIKINNEKILVEANNRLAESYKESLASKDDIISLLKDLVVKLAGK